MTDEDKTPDETMTGEQMDVVEKRDHNRPFTIAQFKVWRKGMKAGLNEVIAKFQSDLVGGQVRLNLAWNAMNAVIRALVKKGLITEADIRDAGVELMSEARANIAKAQVAEKGVLSIAPTMSKVPIEVFRDGVNSKMADKKEE